MPGAAHIDLYPCLFPSPFHFVKGKQLVYISFQSCILSRIPLFSEVRTVSDQSAMTVLSERLLESLMDKSLEPTNHAGFEFTAESIYLPKDRVRKKDFCAEMYHIYTISVMLTFRSQATD